MSARPYAEVIGDPVAHSKSPAIHGFWLARLGIDADYRACHVRGEDLAAYLARRQSEVDWRGCNVTVPHKLAALQLADHADDVARTIGAANCLVRTANGGLAATNTDAAGFAEPLVSCDLAGHEAAVIGAGGAARAVLAALRQRGIGRVTVLNRSPGKASALLEEFALAGQAAALAHPLPPDCRLVVNASTLGMAGQPPLALDLAALPTTACVYDIVYAPLETPLLVASRARGLATIDGLAMLIGQAAAAFALFFGQPAPRQHDAELRALLTA